MVSWKIELEFRFHTINQSIGSSWMTWLLISLQCMNEAHSVPVLIATETFLSLIVVSMSSHHCISPQLESFANYPISGYSKIFSYSILCTIVCFLLQWCDSVHSINIVCTQKLCVYDSQVRIPTFNGTPHAIMSIIFCTQSRQKFIKYSFCSRLPVDNIDLL